MKKLQSLKDSKLSKFENKKIENLNAVAGGEGVTRGGQLWEGSDHYSADYTDCNMVTTYFYCD